MTAPDPSKLDQRQVLQNVHDEERGTLRVDATVFLNGEGPTGDTVRIVDENGDPLAINADGSVNVAEEVPKSLRFEQVSPTLCYLAYGIFGALDTEAKWKIQKIVISDTDVSITNASTDYNQIWDDRASLTYV
jgi:hypothetical protein